MGLGLRDCRVPGCVADHCTNWLLQCVGERLHIWSAGRLWLTLVVTGMGNICRGGF